MIRNIAEPLAESSLVSRPVRWTADCCPILGSSVSICAVSTFSAGLSAILRTLPPFFLFPSHQLVLGLNIRPPCLSLLQGIQILCHLHVLSSFPPHPTKISTVFPNSKSPSLSFTHAGL